MDVETQLNDLGVDAIVGIQLMNQLGLTPYDIAEPSRFQRFQDVVSHLKDNPDREFIIGRITAGKSVDRLDHVWGYSELMKQRSEIEYNNRKTSHSITLLDQENPSFESKYAELKASMEEGLKKYDTVTEHMARYER